MLINGHKLFVEIHGPENGLPVVLLHHGLGSVHAWKAQISALVESGWRVIVYDRWGYGNSGARKGLSIPDFSDDVHDLVSMMDALELSRVALVGHSDGGTIGLYFAAQYPDRVACLVTIAAHIYLEPKMAPGIAAIRERFEKNDRFRASFQRVHGNGFETVFSNWYHGWLQPENLDWDMVPQLKRLACPTLVIQGMEDEHATPQHARDIATNIAMADLWLAPGGRHMLPQEMPEVTNQHLLAFLQKCAWDQ